MPETEIDWQYVGLNHRGFIVSLKHKGQELLRELPQRLRTDGDRDGGASTIGGIAADEVLRVGALPLKYFRAVTHSTIARPGRRQTPGISTEPIS